MWKQNTKYMAKLGEIARKTTREKRLPEINLLRKSQLENKEINGIMWKVWKLNAAKGEDKNKYHGGTSDAAASSSLIVPLILMSFNELLH